jgi:geranylgeranyl reductase family protein
MPDHDVIIAGGGPAGAATAITCVRNGLDTLLVERGGNRRHKPCGGILPNVCAELITEHFGIEIPDEAYSRPRTLGLFYVPPSGRENGGKVRGYSLISVNRDVLDDALRTAASESGAEVCLGTSLRDFKEEGGIEASLTGSDGVIRKVTARALVGADGVNSTVGRQIYGPEDRKLYVYQEHVEAQGDIGDNFCAFFRGDVSPSCGYVLPRDGLLVMGVGVPAESLGANPDPIAPLKLWLSEEFDYREERVETREVWPIPYGFSRVGRGSVLLAGDAAGLCNPLSGEGIRWAIESGAAAGEAIATAMLEGTTPEEVYGEEIWQIQLTLGRIYGFTMSLLDDGWEAFVKEELGRLSVVR